MTSRQTGRMHSVRVESMTDQTANGMKDEARVAWQEDKSSHTGDVEGGK